MMIGISSRNWANIAEGVLTLKQHLSSERSVSCGVGSFVYPA